MLIDLLGDQISIILQLILVLVMILIHTHRNIQAFRIEIKENYQRILQLLGFSIDAHPSCENYQIKLNIVSSI